MRSLARPGAAKRFSRMATTALGPELTAVNVLGAVTCDASARLPDALANALGMARFALQTGVRASEIEVRLRIMIKAPPRPCDRRVAGFAILA